MQKMILKCDKKWLKEMGGRRGAQADRKAW